MKRIFALLLFVLAANAAPAQDAAVRVNALALATGTLNAGVDVTVSRKWSITASGYWGLHTGMARYRVGNGCNRYNGWTAGAGSSVGYAWRVARRWSFALEGGLGLYYMDDTRWKPRPSPVEGVLLRHYHRVVLAPAKLEVSFSYLF